MDKKIFDPYSFVSSQETALQYCYAMLYSSALGEKVIKFIAVFAP
jgi:hypothetical protein